MLSKIEINKMTKVKNKRKCEVTGFRHFMGTQKKASQEKEINISLDMQLSKQVLMKARIMQKQEKKDG